MRVNKPELRANKPESRLNEPDSLWRGVCQVDSRRHQVISTLHRTPQLLAPLRQAMLWCCTCRDLGFFVGFFFLFFFVFLFRAAQGLDQVSIVFAGSMLCFCSAFAVI